MSILIPIISLLFTITAILAAIWSVIGSLVGIVFLIMALSSQIKEIRQKYFKFTIISFAGWGFLVAVFVLYALLMLIATILGYSNNNNLPINNIGYLI